MKKKLLCCTLLAGTLMLGSTVPVMAAETVTGEAAEDIKDTADNKTDVKESVPEAVKTLNDSEEFKTQEAVSGKFTVSKDELEAYDKAFRIFPEHVASVTNNGGKYGSSQLKYLIDGDTSTHWETGKANSSKFKNEVVFTFDKPAAIGSLVYYPRVKGAANKGFPTSYSIYASDSETGDDFKLIAKGTANKASGGTQITFSPAEFTRLKFVFDQADQNWASGAEMVFYAPDTLPDEIDQLFADGTMTSLNPKYQDTAVLEALLEKAKNHPNKHLQELVQMALDIQNGSADYAGQVFQVEQRGNMDQHSRKVLNTGGYSSNILPVGLTSRPGDVIKVYVDVDDGAPLPSIVFSQQIGKFSEWERSYQLKEGENILTTPKIYKDAWASTKVIPGGAIYLTNPYTAKEQGSAPRVRIEGGETYPLFRDGDNVDQFIAELTAYQEKLKAHPDTTVDIVELYSDWFILNGNMKAAGKYLTGEKNPQDVTTFHNTRQQQLLQFAGIDDSSPLNARNNCRANIRLMQPFGAGYAAGGHIGTQQGSIGNFFNGVVGWVYSHEIGHQLDTRGGFIAEVTNNMWANHIAVDIQGEYDRVSYKSIFQKQASDNYKDLVKGSNELGMWWQLHLLDENYWPRYEAAYREKLLADSGLTKKERMAVISCYALNMDVIEHFERYKFIERNDRIDAALAQLNIPKAPDNIKPWYLWTKATLDRTSAFAQDYVPEITAVKRSEDSIKISISMDASSDNALLGYEVMEDGKVLGFTKDNTFTGSYTDDGKDHEYTVRAYDLRMNQSQMSAVYTKNLRQPVLETSGSTLTALHDAFEPLDIITAESYDGQDLTDQIKVVSNTVNTDERGIYEVVYSVSDNDGNLAEKTVEVQVVSRFDYLSDLEETSAEVGYGKLTKDKSISGKTITLLRGNGPVTFEKGLGAHASSSIVYDVENKGYSYFEAYVGIDQAMKGSKASNAIFRVLADGQVIYESQPMKSSTNAEYIRLDIEGVSKLELSADSNGTNGGDHTTWADAKFAAKDSAPVINAADAVYKESEDVSLDEITAQVTASDVEDGDLTGAVTYETDFTPGGTGLFDITYSVTDSDGNTTALTKKIVVVNDYVYASDVDWKNAKVGWGKIQKDKSLNGKEIKMRAEEGTASYEKGIGVHTYSEVVYDLTDKDYYYFTSFVGVDQTAGNGNSSVIFQVYTDGVLAAETPLMKKDTPQQFLCVDVSHAKEVKLVMNNGGNGNANDHGNWADAKFLTAVKTADKTELGRSIEAAKALTESDYTAETWAAFAPALTNAQTVYDNVKASQEETDTAKTSLDQAMEQLKTLVNKEPLEKAIDFAQRADSIDYVDPSLKHRDTRIYNLKAFLQELQPSLENPDITQEAVNQNEKALIYFLEELGQTYNPDGAPVNFAETAPETASENGAAAAETDNAEDNSQLPQFQSAEDSAAE